MSKYENNAIKANAKLKEERMDSSDKKKIIFITFIVVMAFLYGSGYAVGQFIGHNQAGLSGMFTGISTFLRVNMCYIGMAISAVMCIVGFSLYAKTKSLADKWDGEDDELIDDVERTLFYPGAIAQIMMVFTLMAFGISLCNFTLENTSKTQVLSTVSIAAVVMILSIIWTTVLQGKVVSLEKKLNPEKRGNILDFNFQSKWLNSCDEAEKMIVYKSSYDSFKITTYLYGGGCIVAILADLTCKTGVFPIILVSVLWIIQLVVYMNSSRKYSR